MTPGTWPEVGLVARNHTSRPPASHGCCCQRHPWPSLRSWPVPWRPSAKVQPEDALPSSTKGPCWAARTCCLRVASPPPLAATPSGAGRATPSRPPAAQRASRSTRTHVRLSRPGAPGKEQAVAEHKRLARPSGHRPPRPAARAHQGLTTPACAGRSTTCRPPVTAPHTWRTPRHPRARATASGSGWRGLWRAHDAREARAPPTPGAAAA